MWGRSPPVAVTSHLECGELQECVSTKRSAQTTRVSDATTAYRQLLQGGALTKALPFNGTAQMQYCSNNTTQQCNTTVPHNTQPIPPIPWEKPMPMHYKSFPKRLPARSHLLRVGWPPTAPLSTFTAQGPTPQAGISSSLRPTTVCKPKASHSTAPQASWQLWSRRERRGEREGVCMRR